MKKIFTLLIGILFSITVIKAQDSPPQAFSYKATITKANGNILANKIVGLRISILQGSTNGGSVYTETSRPTTNSNGQIDIVIGGSTGLPYIDWSNGPYFLKTEVDINGGTNYLTMSTVQLLSVPYALYADQATTVKSITELDPVFSSSPASGITPVNISDWMTAYGWGDHKGLYRPLSYVPTWTEVIDKPTFATIATSGSYTDLINTPVQLTEPIVEGYIANDITTSYVPRDNGTKLATGSIFDNGVNIGIGTSTPDAKLDVVGTVRIGPNGKIFSEIREIEGVTKGSNSIGVGFPYPPGYTQFNTRVLSAEIFYNREEWRTIGYNYKNPGDDPRTLWCKLTSDVIWLMYPDITELWEMPFRVLLMKAQ